MFEFCPVFDKKFALDESQYRYDMIFPSIKTTEMGNGRTMVESTEHGFWSHPSQKYQIEIFGHRAANTDKKSWRETFTHHWCKFRSKILSPGLHFQIWLILSHPGRKYQIGIFGHRAAKTGWRIQDICKQSSVPGIVFADLVQKTLLAPNLQMQSLKWKAVCIRRTSSNPFWPPYGQKFQFGTFDWGVTSRYFWP